MATLKREECFDAAHFIEVETIEPMTIPFNYLVDDLGYVLVKKEGERRAKLVSHDFDGELKINPKKVCFLCKNRRDPKGYKVFFVPKKSLKATLFGGHSNNKNKDIGTLQYEKIFYTGEFSYEIIDPVSVVECLADDKSHPQSDLDRKIADRLRIDIETICSQHIDEHGLEGLSSVKNKIRDEIQHCVEKYLLDEFGVEIKITKLDFVEEDQFKKIKDKVEMIEFINERIKPDSEDIQEYTGDLQDE